MKNPTWKFSAYATANVYDLGITWKLVPTLFTLIEIFVAGLLLFWSQYELMKLFLQKEKIKVGSETFIADLLRLADCSEFDR